MLLIYPPLLPKQLGSSASLHHLCRNSFKSVAAASFFDKKTTPDLFSLNTAVTMSEADFLIAIFLQSGDSDARGGRGYVAHLQPAASGGQLESIHHKVNTNVFHER